MPRIGPAMPLRAFVGGQEIIAPLLDDARAEGRTVVALSEYGITRVNRPVDINRALRRAGLLAGGPRRRGLRLVPMLRRRVAMGGRVWIGGHGHRVWLLRAGDPTGRVWTTAARTTLLRLARSTRL